jgi:HD-GYP domain-containing protein (c-di-GMP phosphodiesterase class II)
MTNDRPYRKARPVPEALETLRAGAGGQWDKSAVEAFEDISQAGEDVDPLDPLGSALTS